MSEPHQQMEQLPHGMKALKHPRVAACVASVLFCASCRGGMLQWDGPHAEVITSKQKVVLFRIVLIIEKWARCHCEGRLTSL